MESTARGNGVYKPNLNLPAMPISTNIYTLSDPDTNEIRYVGKANNLQTRLKAHCNPARKRKSHKKSWIQSLLAKGKKPLIEVIDHVLQSEWVFWEEYWIRQLTAWGMRLTNHTMGGDGATHANLGSFKPGDGNVPVVKVSLDGTLVERYECAADTGVNMQHVLDKLGKTAKKHMWMREAAWHALTPEELAIRVEAVRKENRYTSFTKFQKGHVTWNTNKKGYSTAKKGSTISLETKNKISRTLTGRTNSGPSKPVDQLTKDNIWIATYPSAAEATRITEIKGILNVINGTAKSAGGFKWQNHNLANK